MIPGRLFCYKDVMFAEAEDKKLADAADEEKSSVRSFADPYSFGNAMKKGNAFTYLSCIIMGAGNIAHKQIVNGLLFLCCEIGYLWFLLKPYGGEYWISKLPSLGDTQQVKVWNDAKGVFEYKAGDNSQLILLYAIAALFMTAVFIFVWQMTVRSAYQALCLAADW